MELILAIVFGLACGLTGGYLMFIYPQEINKEIKTRIKKRKLKNFLNKEKYFDIW